jgi:hypothetical protein
MRRLLAIGDLHLSHKFNREAFQTLEAHEDDGLIICTNATLRLRYWPSAKRPNPAKSLQVVTLEKRQSTFAQLLS